MPISRDTIELVRDRSRIEEIVRRYVPSLKKRGANFVGLCPFHKEKTPSFTVSPEKQIFYCFGCHTGGNVYAFISKVERLNFPESVRFLGNLAGIEIREDRDDARVSRFEYLKRVNTFAMNVYHQALFSETGRAARDYALGRGVKVESIKEFKLGFAPDSWNYLTEKLVAKDVDLARAAELGLIAESAKSPGKRYDRFRNRLMFPIFDRKGEAIAFGGRVLGEGEPKYLNSPESDLFRKGNVLYGFHLARDVIAEMKRAIVVEGYLDVIGCFQNGVRNVVAPLGTALTSHHVEFLSRYCTEIILLFDSDSAGVNASLRSLDVVGERSVDVKVAMLPESDPFEFITKKGIRPFMAVVDSALHPVEFRIQRTIAGTANAPRVKMLTALFGVIDGVAYDTEKRAWLKRIGELLGLDERALFDDYGRYAAGERRPESLEVSQGNADGDRPDFLARCHRDLVLLLLNHPDIVENAVLDFNARGMSDPVARSLFTKIAELYAAGEAVSIDRMFDIFQEGEEREFLEKSLEKSFVAESPKDAYSEIYVNVKLFWIDSKIEKLMADIRSSKDGNTGESLAEVEVLRRDKEKLLSFLRTRRQ